MRRIELKTVLAGPEGVLHPGKHTVPDNIAADLVAANHAEYADDLPAPQKAVVKQAEKAVVKPAETADAVVPEKAWGKGASK